MHAAYSEATGYYVLLKSEKEVSTVSNQTSQDRKGALSANNCSKEPAEAAPGQDSVISVDECAYDRNTVGCATNSPRKRLTTQQLHS